LFKSESGDEVAYEYGPDSILVGKQVSGENQINYLVDTYNQTGYPHVFKQNQMGTDDIVYILGTDAIGQSTATGGLRSYLYDGHDSVRQVSNSSGAVIGKHHFDAYGRLLAHSDTTVTNILYVGQMWDNETNLYNNWHRWYDPATGIFNAPDPYLGATIEPQSLHRYLYCHNNPVNGADPTGLVFWTPYHGTILHQKIGWDFRNSSFNLLYANYVNINTILGTRLSLFGLQRPDLVDMVTNEVYEIKPTGMYITGAAQLGWYLLLLNSFDPLHRVWKPGITYIPKPMIEVYPGCVALVSPPVAGVIQYEVIDMPTIVSFVVAYNLAELYAHTQIITLRMTALRVPF
jgi:RHS repeat-associated protein